MAPRWRQGDGASSKTTQCGLVWKRRNRAVWDVDEQAPCCRSRLPTAHVPHVPSSPNFWRQQAGRRHQANALGEPASTALPPLPQSQRARLQPTAATTEPPRHSTCCGGRGHAASAIRTGCPSRTPRWWGRPRGGYGVKQLGQRSSPLQRTQLVEAVIVSPSGHVGVGLTPVQGPAGGRYKHNGAPKPPWERQ